MTSEKTSRPDTELWTAVLAGEQAAWRELVLRYKSLVYSVCTYLGLSQVEAGDAFQQTWLLLYEKRKQVRDPQRLSAWLVTTARREALRLKDRARTTSSLDEVAGEIPCPGADPEEELLLVERQAVLEAAIDKLDSPCRELVRSFFFAPENLSYEKIARQLGYSPNTLGAKRQRCLGRLRKILERLGYLDERKSEKEPLL
jgi:RNA polymerase sigma factor (sigma-70 family)